MYCDPTVQCIHIGTHLTVDIANRYKELRLSILNEVDRSKKELSEFTGLSFKEVSDKCYISTDLVAEQYKHSIIESNEDPKNSIKRIKTIYLTWLIGIYNQE